MANRKDMRREELIVPYMEPEAKKDDNDIQGTMSSALPMAAIFTRNKMIGWTAVMVAIQGWLSETSEHQATSSTPGYFSLGMAVMSLGVAYIPFFLPPTGPGLNTPATGTGAAAPTPPS